MLPERVWRLLACPTCGGALSRTTDGATCAVCHVLYPAGRAGQLDLRLQQPKVCHLDVQLGADALVTSQSALLPLEPNPQAQVDVRSLPIEPAMADGNRLTPEFLSYLPRGNGGIMLDLGCGQGRFRAFAQPLGFEYVGLDTEHDAASVLGDAHCLPFQDESFDLVVSLAVLEHLRYPFVAAREVARVLKAGGMFFGTVAFLEPFHLNSYYHPTHLGTYNLLKHAGLDVVKLAPNVHWTGLKALMAMGLFPRLPRWLVGAAVWPMQVLHRIWWAVGAIVHDKASEQLRLLSTTGGFRFVATKPPAGSSSLHPAPPMTS